MQHCFSSFSWVNFSNILPKKSSVFSNVALLRRLRNTISERKY
jgi:hypothetical protein